jgi:poly(A) polymerase
MSSAEIIRQQIFASHPSSFKLLTLLNSPTHESRIIGGAIRNALLNQSISDIDIATTLLPNEVIELAKTTGYKTVPTGIAHGTITVVVDKHGFEVTTLRQDIETNGRHATVEFSRDFEVDAMRRDFTVNALSLGLTGDIHDYTGGLADIEQHTIRFIGDPVQRIREDYLRILRFFRFSAFYSKGKLDAAGLKACLAQRVGLASLSRERVGHEIRKLLIAPYVVQTISELANTQLLEELLGTPINYQTFNALVDIEAKTNTPPTPMRRLAALIAVQTCNLELLRDALKLSNKEYEQLLVIQSALNQLSSTLSDNAGHPLPLRERVSSIGCSKERPSLQKAMGRERGKNSTTPNHPNFKPLIYKLGASIFTDWLLLFNSNLESVQAGLHLAQTWTIPKNPFSGSYFIKLGCKAGPKLGELLKQAEHAWIEHDFPNEAEKLKLIAEKIMLKS